MAVLKDCAMVMVLLVCGQMKYEAARRGRKLLAGRYQPK